VVTLAKGLDRPWSIAFLPDGDYLVPELPGQVRLIHNGVVQAHPIGGVPQSQLQGHGGLLDIELHPDFKNNHLAYIAYSKAGEKGVTTAIFRARYEGGQFVDGKDISVADAWARGGLNPGGRMVFDNKGLLYFGVGDRGPTGEPCRTWAIITGKSCGCATTGVFRPIIHSSIVRGPSQKSSPTEIARPRV